MHFVKRLANLHNICSNKFHICPNILHSYPLASSIPINFTPFQSVRAGEKIPKDLWEFVRALLSSSIWEREPMFPHSFILFLTYHFQAMRGVFPNTPYYLLGIFGWVVGVGNHWRVIPQFQENLVACFQPLRMRTLKTRWRNNSTKSVANKSMEDSISRLALGLKDLL